VKSFLQVRITTNKRRSVSHDENGKQLGAHHSWHNRPESARLHKHKFGTETQICAIEISHLPMMITQIFLQNSSKNASTRPVRIRKLVACEFRLRFASASGPKTAHRDPTRVPNRDQRIEYRVNPALQLNTSTRLAEDQCIESVQESQVWSQIRQSLQGIMACPSKRTRRTHG